MAFSYASCLQSGSCVNKPAMICRSSWTQQIYKVGGSSSWSLNQSVGALSSSSNCYSNARSSMYMVLKEIEKDGEERMQKSMESVLANFNTIRTGRANPAILDRVMVSYYGVETPLRQLASISTPSSTVIAIDAFDKTSIKDIEKGILESDIGLTPQNDGVLIRLNIPQLTQDRRKEMVKQLKQLAEDGRVAVRNIRRDCVDKMKKLEKDSEVSKDEAKDGQDAIQKLTDKYVKQIDSLLADKEKEVMKV
mmetsp:Transcript_7788/g.14145  ORF Transcript_7788/g.14145 Transcript_7788/m.14145 type:complete len:250 (-) Transcript_7788:14-763(-)